MDKPEVEKILELITGETDRASVTVLYNATVEKFGAYNQDKSRVNLMEWQAADKALKAKVEEMTAKYCDAPGTRILADRVEAWRFLEAEGYKVGRQTVYNAAKSGKLIVQADGSIYESDALAFAAKNLKKASGKTGKAADKVADERASEELSLIKTKRERMQFEYDRERGKYMLKTDVHAEIAIKIAAFDAGIKHVFRTFAADWIHRVGGDTAKTPLFLDLVYSECDLLLNEFGRMDDIGVIVVKASAEGLVFAVEEERESGIFAMDTDVADKPKETADGIVGDA